MTSAPHVVGISGSLRDASHTRTAVRIALTQAAEMGASTELVDLREYDLPVFDPDDRDAGDAERLRRTVTEADSLLLASPMYHGSYSSAIKNALDYCGFDEFEDKTVGLMAIAGGRFPTGTLDHLRTVSRALDAWVLPHQVAIPSASNQFEDGELTDEDLERRVTVLGQRLVEYASIEPDPASFESTENIGAD